MDGADRPGPARGRRPVVVVGASPDHLNRNSALRALVAEGFAQAAPDAPVAHVPLDTGPDTVARLRPGLTVCFGSVLPDECDYTDLRRACTAQGSPLVFWLHDDPYEIDMRYRAQDVADVIFTNDRAAVRHYEHPRVHHLPLGASQVAHFREVAPERSTDLFFCGVAFANRVRLLADLAPKLRDRDCRIFGDGWPDLNGLAAVNRRLDQAELLDGYAGARLTLNIGRDDHLANAQYALAPSTPGPRTFEAAMAGAVQAMFVTGLEIEEYYAPNEEILLFDSPDEFADMLESLRTDPARVRRIATAAQDRTLREHTYAHRAARLLEICKTPAGADAP
ncbi:MAG: CgeB family protein [Planctomycetota bacterium]|jgi:spore maturation protein CgeB